MVNKTRKTIEVGDQIFYCYGNRTNKFLLLNYGFCFPDNKYDSYEFPMRLDVPIKETFTSHVIDIGWQSKGSPKMRLKSDQLCYLMLAYLRFMLKRSFITREVASNPTVNLARRL